MLKSDFNYNLPEELIAQKPLPDRKASRLMHLQRNSKHIEHRQFFELEHLLKPNDLLVLNNSAVMLARLFGKKDSGGKIEILVERLIDKHTALVHIRSSKSPKPQQIFWVEDKSIEIVEKQSSGRLYTVVSQHPWVELMQKHGHLPLPPYIQRQVEKSDHQRYQTVYAQHSGSVAAPTAGLHFTQELIDTLKQKSIQFASLTLHVGAGTFLPVQTDNIADHMMHAEWIDVSEECCEKIRMTKQAGGRVIAVGTTAVRSLETAAGEDFINGYQGETDIFIKPGYKFKVIDGLITNFHLPESTLLMLVSALAGREFVLQAYQAAVENNYRFFSYGDAMLIT